MIDRFADGLHNAILTVHNLERLRAEAEADAERLASLLHLHQHDFPPSADYPCANCAALAAHEARKATT